MIRRSGIPRIPRLGKLQDSPDLLRKAADYIEAGGLQ
jgi:hypothetical protein